MTALMHTYTGGQDPHPTTPVTQHRDSIPQARLGDPKMEGGTGEKTYVKPSLAAEGQTLLCAIHKQDAPKKAPKDIRQPNTYNAYA